MEKRILVPTNFSKTAWNSLIFGLNMFKYDSCRFFLMNAYQSRNSFAERVSLVKRESDEEEDEAAASEKGLDRLLQGLNFRRENSYHEFETLSIEGKLTDAVNELVEEHNIDLILLGSPGDHAMINTAYNGKISHIVEETHSAPILVVPETYNFVENPDAEIVFPTNFRIPFKKSELEPLLDMASNLGAAVRVLYIDQDEKGLAEDQKTNSESLRMLLSGVKNSFHTLTKTSMNTGIHLFMQSRESDILALYKRKTGFFGKLFSQSKIEEIDFDPILPVLILKEIRS